MRKEPEQMQGAVVFRAPSRDAPTKRLSSAVRVHRQEQAWVPRELLGEPARARAAYPLVLPGKARRSGAAAGGAFAAPLSPRAVWAAFTSCRTPSWRPNLRSTSAKIIVMSVIIKLTMPAASSSLTLLRDTISKLEEGQPVLPEQLAHRRAGADPAQQLVVFTAQHPAPPAWPRSTEPYQHRPRLAIRRGA